MFISPAFAQDAGASSGDMFSFVLPIALMFGVFWLLVFRPQQKKMKQLKEMVANLKRGDQVLTGGGLYGRVARIEGGNVCYVEIAPNVKVKIAQSTIAEVIARPEPQGAGEAESKESKDGGDEKTVEKSN
jgi:preprotein translocase subunit YajC